MVLPGSRRSVEELVNEHYRSLYAYAYRLTGGSSADAEDLTQETFCQAQMKLAQLRDWSRAKAWLFSILRNAYLHSVRGDKHEQLMPLDWLNDFAERSPEALPEVEPEQLQEALNELPEVFRTPVILFYFDELSYRDIAEQMDLPMGTVMSRLARAKAYLRGMLSGPPPRGRGQGEGEPAAVTNEVRRSK